MHTSCFSSWRKSAVSGSCPNSDYDSGGDYRGHHSRLAAGRHCSSRRTPNWARTAGEDCDVDLEISQTADRNAPRVIVETPVDSEFCSARKNIQSQLAQHGFSLDVEHGGELPQALPADILGMAFEDFEHNRGSGQVATLWELHPATVNLLP